MFRIIRIKKSYIYGVQHFEEFLQNINVRWGLLGSFDLSKYWIAEILEIMMGK